MITASAPNGIVADPLPLLSTEEGRDLSTQLSMLAVDLFHHSLVHRNGETHANAVFRRDAGLASLPARMAQAGRWLLEASGQAQGDSLLLDLPIGLAVSPLDAPAVFTGGRPCS